MLQDESLLKLIKKGDESGVKKLFDKYYICLCAYAKSITRDHHAAEEIVEDLFIYLWINAAKININISLKSYLFKSIHNNSIKYLNKQKTKNKVFEHYQFSDNEILNTRTNDNPYEGMIAKELGEKAEKILDSLPEKCREIYSLNRFNDLSYPEIARRLNISVGTVKTQMSRAFKKFREELGGGFILTFITLL